MEAPEPTTASRTISSLGKLPFEMIRSVAPGRICLLGDHQDYLLLPIIACAIDREIVIDAEENETMRFVIHKNDLCEHEVIPLLSGAGHSDGECVDKHGNPDFLRLSLIVLKRYGCVPNKGYDIHIKGNIPINAGLSSSSALTVAFIHFLVTAFGIDIDGVGAVNTSAATSQSQDQDDKPYMTIPDFVLARLAWETEVLELKTSGGKMDHYTICVGGMIFLDTKTDEFEAFKFSPWSLPEELVLIVGVSGEEKDTNATLSHLKSHQLCALDTLRQIKPDFCNDSLSKIPSPCYERCASTFTCESHGADADADADADANAYIQNLLDLMSSDEVVDRGDGGGCRLSPQKLKPFLRAALMNHRITLNAQCTLQALQDKDSNMSNAQARVALQRLGNLVTAHHCILRDDLKNSTTKIEAMISSAMDVPDCLGAKIVGSGGGGCVVALAFAPQAQAVVNALLQAGATDAFAVKSLSSGPRVVCSPKVTLKSEENAAFVSVSRKRKSKDGILCAGGVEGKREGSISQTTNTASIISLSQAAKNTLVHDSFAKSSSGKIEPTADDANKQVFCNFLEACKHYNYPGSHQHGSIGNKDGIFRTYSNSTPGKDRVLHEGHEVHYRLKNKDVQSKFALNKKSGQCVRFFRKVEQRGDGGKLTKAGCKDMGLYRVCSFIENDAFVRLVQA